MAVRVRCINKDNGFHENPHEEITHYGWVNEATGATGKSDRSEMVDWVKKGNRAYVNDTMGRQVDCYVRRSPRGTEFLQTEADGRVTNNLLALPECI